MKSWVGRVGVVGLGLLSVACDTPPDIHIRVFHSPRTEADYRVTTVIGGLRYRPKDEQHFAPPFTLAMPPLPDVPNLTLRLTPARAFRESEPVCMDVQRRGRWPELLQTVRICTSFVANKHLVQDVYFDTVYGCHREPGDGPTSQFECPDVPPGCRRLTPAELARIEARVTPPPSGAQPLNDPEWGDPLPPAPNEAPWVPPCAYECPPRDQQPPRQPPYVPPSVDAEAMDVPEDSPMADVAEEPDVPELHDASDDLAHDASLPYCAHDAAMVNEAGAVVCVMIPP
ncbi:MAG: hypothetical protein Q8Q09_19705 [Deltaproteobacteria bacterium]|nr:hypothetical protein [Deltaproteobacteria bacterium]